MQAVDPPGQAPERRSTRPCRVMLCTRALAAWLAVLVTGIPVGGCAAPSDDIHLPPLFSAVSRAGGGREVEALAGAIRLRRATPTSPIGEWALRPLVSHVTEPTGGTTRFLVPLGIDRRRPDDTRSELRPLYWYLRHSYEDGTRRWRFFSLPGLLFGRLPDGRRSWAVFPLGGRIHEFLSWDELHFALFPLFAHTSRGERDSWHVMWPFFNRGESLGGGHTFRILPFYAESVRPGKFEGRSILWPFFNRTVDGLDRPPEERTKQWLLWPLIGRKVRGSYRATTWLWPFFGYAHDSRTGFWAWDGPWPFVRFQGGGANPKAEVRRRFWPFWSHFEADGLTSTYYLWPIVNSRTEEYPEGTRRALYVLPLWQHWKKEDSEDRTLRAWTKLWPVFQDYEEDGARRFAFPALNPLWPTPIIDDHYAWIYELFAVSKGGGLRSERSWGGLWRREVDALEDRAYLAGLWSRRRHGRVPQRVTETSLLFGLLRWSSSADDPFQAMMPAFPGPGWPAHRAQQ